MASRPKISEIVTIIIMIDITVLINGIKATRWGLVQLIFTGLDIFYHLLFLLKKYLQLKDAKSIF